jgi:hypothetical protein
VGGAFEVKSFIGSWQTDLCFAGGHYSLPPAISKLTQYFPRGCILEISATNEATAATQYFCAVHILDLQCVKWAQPMRQWEVNIGGTEDIAVMPTEVELAYTPGVNQDILHYDIQASEGLVSHPFSQEL